MDKELLARPPADWLVASYLGYKAPHTTSGRSNAGRENAEALRQMPMLTRKPPKSLTQLPSYLQTPEKLALIERMKAEANAR